MSEEQGECAVEEELDFLQEARQKCTESNRNVKKVHAVLLQCNDRVNSKSYTTETCHEEMVDYVMAMDKCVGHSVFDKLV